MELIRQNTSTAHSCQNYWGLYQYLRRLHIHPFVGILGDSKSHVMNLTRTSLLSLSFALISLHALGQLNHYGIWTVQSVNIDQESMTPVAKWFDISEDGSVIGGNGGMVNIRGTWAYDESIAQVLFSDGFGTPDPMGPFTVRMNEDTLWWIREEEGMLVTVVLQKAQAIPEGPWDYCTGSWINSEDESEVLSLSWDRSFRNRTKGGNQEGIWHIGAHSPRLSLFTRDGQNSTWQIDFPDKMTMTLTSDFGNVKTYKRQLDQ